MGDAFAYSDGGTCYGHLIGFVIPWLKLSQPRDRMRGLDHEGLDVYRIARELSREINRVMKKARHKRERRDLVNQVLRATASVPLNICEGSGERAPGRRAYFFRVARGSATELAGALDHMVDMEMLAEDDTVSAKSLISRIVAMLVRLTDTVTTPDS